MLDFVRQFPRFEAQETIQDREVATHERDLRNVCHGESHKNKRALVHLFLSSTRVPLFMCVLSS